MRTFDTVIVGAGIIGLSVARELRYRHADMTIAVLEKERQLGLHASGRNSGVLHSGIYYPVGSLKGRICAAGARALASFCDANRLPIERIGKVILPVIPSDDAQLDVLVERARSNGANASLINERELAELEPAARSCSGRALWSPNTAVIDPKKILSQLETDLLRSGVEILKGHRVSDVVEGRLIADNQAIGYGHLVNAAGLHADVVAKALGVGSNYRILPFKGLYYEVAPLSPVRIRRLIYPVPDLRVPFLGVHFTRTPTGEAFVGPSAIPALGRENYQRLEGMNAGDLSSIVAAMARQYISGKQGFRTFVAQEVSRLVKSNFVKAAQALVPQIRGRDLLPSSKVGIRAQLFDMRKNEMVMDFLIEQGPRSTHVLNAVSPGLTSAFEFAKLVADHVEGAGG